MKLLFPLSLSRSLLQRERYFSTEYKTLVFYDLGGSIESQILKYEAYKHPIPKWKDVRVRKRFFFE